MSGKKVKQFLRKYLFFSFNSTINVFYITLIIMFVSITGGVSFYIATEQIEENTYETVGDIVVQTNNYLNFVLSDVFEQLVVLSNDPKLSTLILNKSEHITPRFYIEMDQLLKSISHRYHFVIDSILIDVNDGSYTFYYAEQREQDTNFSYQDYFSQYRGSKEGFYWRNLHKDEVSTLKDDVLSVFKLIGDEESESKGIILFTLKKSFLEEVLDKSLIGENGYLTIVSPDSHFESEMVDAKYRLTDEALSYLNESELEKGKFSFDSEAGEKMMAVFQTLGVNKWKIVAVLPEKEMFQKVDYIKYFTISFLLFIILIAVYFVNRIGNYIAKPIKRLADHMSKPNPKLDIGLREGLAEPQEMKILYDSFHEQLLRNKKLLEQIKIEQEEKRQLEVAIIQAQIDPHFLYNTLYSIKGLCDMGMNDEASEMISALSQFYRISISRGNEVISIKEEIEHIKSYLYIMEMRYGDQFTYSLDIEEDILDCNILNLTLQPLVENAIYHGVKQIVKQGHIEIKGYQSGKNICLQVIDDGVGIEEKELEKILKELEIPFHHKKEKKYIGVGLKSVNERLKIHFGKEYGLFIKSEKHKGTEMTVIIPKVKGGSKHV